MSFAQIYIYIIYIIQQAITDSSFRSMIKTKFPMQNGIKIKKLKAIAVASENES